MTFHCEFLLQNGKVNYKGDLAGFPEPEFSTVSTQTPPEFAPSDEDPQPGTLLSTVLPQLRCERTVASETECVPMYPVASVPGRLHGG